MKQNENVSGDSWYVGLKLGNLREKKSFFAANRKCQKTKIKLVKYSHCFRAIFSKYAFLCWLYTLDTHIYVVFQSLQSPIALLLSDLSSLYAFFSSKKFNP
jgi:hypothetical protein